MKKLKTLGTALLAAAVILPGLAGCVMAPGMIPGTTEQGDDANQTGVTKVNIIESSTSIYVGETVKLNVSVSTTTGIANTVTWKSSNESIASVNSSGVVTGKAVGTVTITATSTVDSTKKDTCSVTIKEAAWSASEKSIMEENFGEVLPFVLGFELVDGADYGYEGSYWLAADGDKVTVARNAFLTAGWTYEGTEYDSEYDCDDYYYSKASAADSDYALTADIYCLEYEDDDGKAYKETSVDIYVDPISYTTWPTSVISDHLSQLGITATIQPVVESGIEVSVTYSELDDEDATEVVVVSVSCADNSFTTGDSYVASLGTTNYTIIEIEGGYQLQAKDKSHTLFVYNLFDEELYFYYELYSAFGALDELLEELDMTEDELLAYLNTPFPGFTLVIADYIADYSINLNGDNELLAVNETLQLEAVLGADIPLEATLTYTSSNQSVATVNNTGLITAVGAGTTTITVAYSDKASASITISVLATIGNDWTTAQQEDLEKVVSGIQIPFSKYLDKVSFDEEEKVATLQSSYKYGIDQIESIHNALVAAGWTDYLVEGDTVEDAIFYDGYIAYDKIFTVSEVEHCIYIDLYFIEGEENDTSWKIGMDVYDPYIYSATEAKTALGEALGALEIETTAELPDFTGDRFMVSVNEDDGYVYFEAVGANLTLAQVKDLFTAKGFTGDIITEDDISILQMVSSDEGLVIKAGIDEGDLVIYFELPAADGVTFDFSVLTTTSGSEGDVSFSTGLGSNSNKTAPAYNSNKKELRLYIGNTITITASSPITSIFFNANTCGETKTDGTLSCNTGEIEEVDGGFYWEGNATSVTFTVDSGKQVHINSIDVNGGAQ